MALTYLQTRALQALRAPGGMTADQAWGRWPESGAKPFHTLRRRGLAACDGGVWTITEAGRAACPFNNSILAGKPPTPPPTQDITENTMNEKLNPADLLAAIEAAGPAGATVKALTVLLDVSDQTIFNRLKALTREPGAAVVRPRKGLLVAARFVDVTPPLPALTLDPSPVGRGKTFASPLPLGEGSGVRVDGQGVRAPASTAAASVPEAEVAKIAKEYDEMIDFALEPSGEMPVQPARDEELLRQAQTIVDLRALVAEQQDKIAELLAREGVKLLVADVDIDDPEIVEFAVYSSGGLDIITDGPTVALGAATLAKLRAFLGLFEVA